MWISKLSLILKAYVQSCRDTRNIGKKFALFIYLFCSYIPSSFSDMSHCYSVIPSCQLFLIIYKTICLERGTECRPKCCISLFFWLLQLSLVFFLLGIYNCWIPLYTCVHFLFRKLKLPCTHFMRSRLGLCILLFIMELRPFWFL